MLREALHVILGPMQLPFVLAPRPVTTRNIFVGVGRVDGDQQVPIAVGEGILEVLSTLADQGRQSSC